MGNKLCCEETRDLNTISNEQEKIKNLEENNLYISNVEKNNDSENYNYNDNNMDNNNLDNNAENKNSNENIHNLKSSLFDNENDNPNYEENDIDNNFKLLTTKGKINADNNKLEFHSERNYLKNNKKQNSGLKKKKNELGYKKEKENENIIEVEKVINNNPDFKTTPLDIKNFNNNKENDFYLINTTNYIGLRNSNSNLVFIKNNKDIYDNKPEVYSLFSNTKTNIIRNNNNLDNILNKASSNNYNISNTQKTTSVNPNIIITTRNHNIPYGEKMSDNISITSKILEHVNLNKITENINNKNYKIIEIYIKNQIKKIIKLIKDKSNKTSKDIVKKSNNENFNDLNNNGIKINQFNNFSNNFIDILNSNSCHMLMNKGKNFGIKIFDNGSKYIGGIGNINSNNCSGIGKYINSKGDIIKGYFKDNYLHGYGILERNRNNYIFEGQVEKNKFNGYGIEVFQDGSSYYGGYKNNEKSGIGTYNWSDGAQYQGEWKKGLPDGMGIYYDAKNRKYEGEWKKGKMNGIGLFKWDDGRKYFGYFKQDKREGFGIFFWNNPLKIYLGFWVNGLQNGIGKLYTSFKEKYYLYENGKKNQLSDIKKNDLQNNGLIRKYYYFFKMTIDDLMTLMLDL